MPSSCQRFQRLDVGRSPIRRRSNPALGIGRCAARLISAWPGGRSEAELGYPAAHPALKSVPGATQPRHLTSHPRTVKKGYEVVEFCRQRSQHLLAGGYSPLLTAERPRH